MASAGALTVSLSLEQAAFVAGTREAGRTIDEFGKSINKGKEHVQGFNTHMLASRHAIQAFAGIGGVAAGPIMHLVHAFAALPGPMGLALGGLLALREVYNAHGEAVKKAAEEQEKFHEFISKSGAESGETQKFADTITKSYEQIAAKAKEAEANLAGLFTPGNVGKYIDLKTQIIQLQAIAAAADKSKIALDEFHAITEKFEDRKLDLSIQFDPKSSEYASGIMDALQEKLDHLSKSLSTMAVGEKGFSEMNKAFRETDLELIKLQREMDEVAKKKAERSQEGTRRMEEDAENVVKGLQGRFTSASDKIRKDIETLGEAYGEGGIGEKGYIELKAKLNVELDDAKLKEALEQLNKDHSLMELKQKLSKLEHPEQFKGDARAGQVDTRFQSIESLTKGGTPKHDVRNEEEEKYLKAQIGILEKIALNTKGGAMMGVAG